MSIMLTAVADRFRLGDVLACAPVRHGLMNPNWRLTTTGGVWAVKRLRDVPPSSVRRQSAVLPLLAARGVPVSPPLGGEVDGDYYAVARWLPGAHREGRELPIDACRSLGDLLGRIHIGLNQVLPVPPSSSAEPRTVEDARADLERLGRTAAGGRDEFDRFAAAETERRLRLLDEIAHRRPSGGTEQQPIGWTHGDLNHLNLLFDGDTVCGVLDWDRVGVRPYGLEVVRTATVMFDTGDLRRVSAFAAGYRGRVAISDDALRDAAHRRWWTLATDTYFLRRHYDHGDHACDHLMRRSSEVLRWWTAHRAEFDRAWR
jgi:Ser/Thr protein kinase RdoA (MazF antagonist)